MSDNCTYFRCTSCGKELISMAQPGPECPQCQYLHALGIYTIEQYNAWLRKEQSCK